MNVFQDGFFVTAEDIYRWLSEGPGADSLNLAQDVTRHEMERENQRADQIVSLSNAVQSGWQGGAGETAYSAVSPLAASALRGADQLRTSQDLLSRQSASFTDAANRVQPVPENPPQNALDDAFPFDTDIDKETQDYQSAAQNNMAVFREYDGASSYNETNMPSEYNTTGRPMGNVTVTPPPDTIEVGEPSGPRSGGPGGPGGPGEMAGPGNYSGYGAGPSGYPGGGPAPVGPHPGTVPSGGQTTPNDYRPSPQPPYSYPPSYPPVTRPSPVSADPGSYAGGAPYGGYQGGGGSGGGGFGPRGSGGGAGGSGPGGRGFGAAPGPGPGAAAGALAAEEAAARRAAQAAAGARPGGAGAMGAPMGGARNKDDEDTEHERKILLETDAEETFGSDVLTAPQVIGDDEYED